MIIIMGGMTMTLSEVPRGQKARIDRISDPMARLQAIRFGIVEGTIVTCTESISRGPVVIEQNGQELAIGRRLADRIEVHPAGTGGDAYARESVGRRPGPQFRNRAGR